MIILIKNQKVMLDHHLSKILGLSTKTLNKGMNRLAIGKSNLLTTEEFQALKIKSEKNYSRPPKYYPFDDIKEYILKIKMNVNKKEINYEKTVLAFLNKKKFTLIEHQPNVMGKKPDFLLQKANKFYLVEIQVGQLDYHHLYKIIAYRDFWFISKGFIPNALLIAESIPTAYHSLLQKYNLEFIAIPRDDNEPELIKIYKNKEDLIIQIMKYFS